MKSTVTMFCILALAVGLVLPVYAEVQNVKVSGDITLRGFYRSEYATLDDDAGTDDSDAFYTSAVRLRVDADLTDNVSTTVRLLNERDWDTEAAASDTDIDLDLAYITLREFLYAPLTATLGRQLLRYGSALVVGDPDTNSASVAPTLTALDYSARKSFDALKVALDYDPVMIDILTAKIAETVAANNDVDLYGINFAYKLEEHNGVFEAYYFLSDAETGTDGTVFLGSQTHTLGIRANGDPIERLTLEGEFAYQFGDYDDDTVNGAGDNDSPTVGVTLDQEAWALILGVKYVFDTDYVPTIGLRYTYLSGDDNATADTDNEAWLPLFEDQVNGEIANALAINDSNIHIINLSGSIRPTDQIGISLNYYHYTLAEDTGADPAGPADPSAGGWPTGVDGFTLDATEDDLGDEVDIALTYDYSEDVQFGLLFAWFAPGDVFDEPANDDAIEVVGSVSVVF